MNGNDSELECLSSDEDLKSEDVSDDHGGGDEVNSDAEDTDGDSSTADLTSQPKGKKTFRYGEKET